MNKKVKINQKSIKIKKEIKNVSFYKIIIFFVE